MKKASYIILTLIMLFGLVSLCACNNTTPTDNSDYTDPTPVDYFTFEPNADHTGYIITGTNRILPANVIIPSEYLGRPITEIGESSFRGYNTIKSITLPTSITTIGSYSFAACSALERINFNNAKINMIEYCAFQDCTALADVEIPSSVTEISSYAFSGCTNLKNIKFNDTLETIYPNAFEGCSALVELKLPASLKGISSKAFASCSSLKKINFPEALTYIDCGAFDNCIGLTSLQFPENLDVIYASAEHDFITQAIIDELSFPLQKKFLTSSQLLTCEFLGTQFVSSEIFNCGAFNGCINLIEIQISKKTIVEPCSFLDAKNLSIIYY